MATARATLTTDRLALVPSGPDYAEAGFKILSERSVADTLNRVNWPVDRAVTDRWFGQHPQEWEEGRAYRFAACLEGKMIGLIDLEEIGDAAELGFWLEAEYRGKGLGEEAALAVVTFGIETCNFTRIEASHAVGKIKSLRMLSRLGFRPAESIGQRGHHQLSAIDGKMPPVLIGTALEEKRAQLTKVSSDITGRNITFNDPETGAVWAQDFPDGNEPRLMRIR